MMPNTRNDISGWLTASDGKAHYVLGGACLCGAKVKNFGEPPKRKRLASGQEGTFLTPRCYECMNRNYIRWAESGGRT